MNFTTALQWYYGFYLNDSYKISSRFSVNSAPAGNSQVNSMSGTTVSMSCCRMR